MTSAATTLFWSVLNQTKKFCHADDKHVHTEQLTGSFYLFQHVNGDFCESEMSCIRAAESSLSPLVLQQTLKCKQYCV